MGRTAVAVLACALALGGCAAVDDIGPGSEGGSSNGDLSPVDRARTAIAAGNLAAADAVLGSALAPAPDKKNIVVGSGPAIRGNSMTADLLVLRSELRIRQGRYPEAESDALTAMALVPATATAEVPPEIPAAVVPYGPTDGREGADKDAPPSPAPRFMLTQRSIHIRLAHLYEDAGRDDSSEQHLEAARALCIEDSTLDCELERKALVRIRMARGRYAQAEPLVLAGIAEVQQRYGPDDIRLSLAFCDAARFYARQGKYVLSGPLYARSFNLWKTSREEAFNEHTRYLAAGQPSPFDKAFLTPRAGHVPFTAPCGLEDQGVLLYKLGKAGVAADALRYEQQLWAADTEGGIAAVKNLDELIARNADALDIAAARNAVAFVSRRKGDNVRAETELRLVTEAYAAAWPTLAVSDRRFHIEDYLRAIESLVDLLRNSQRHAEAVAFGERAKQIATADVDAYDSLRLDTILSVAKTFREMRDAERAVGGATVYLDAVVKARGDESSDYAWALRTISFAYLLRDELDASQRMEMQAKAIWAKENIVAPEF